MNVIVRVIRARPRLILAALGGGVVYVILPGAISALLRAILAWDFCCAAFIAMAAVMFSIEPMARLAADARRDQEGEWTIFWITIGATGASFAAIVSAFSQTRQVSAETRGLLVALVAVTLLLSWLMTHALFALRYAHEYYDGPEDGSVIAGGLEFPGGESPDYWDFFYFAIVVGMTFQVSDVQITSRGLRRLAAAHGMIGFLFNTVIVALSVNMGASLL